MNGSNGFFSWSLVVCSLTQTLLLIVIVLSVGLSIYLFGFDYVWCSIFSLQRLYLYNKLKCIESLVSKC